MMDSRQYAQFVLFKTAGSVPSELFQQSWIPIAKGFMARGIESIILSAKVPIQGELSQFTFVSKNWWDSIRAVQGTFPNGLPGPAGRGHITVSQGGIFKVVEATDLRKHQVVTPKTKNNFKVLFMLPASIEASEQRIQQLKSKIQGVEGHDSLCLYKLDKCSGDLSKPWLFGWIVEAYFNSSLVAPEEILHEFQETQKLSKDWEICVHKDDMQLTPQDL